jgi:hypothetical protein
MLKQVQHDRNMTPQIYNKSTTYIVKLLEERNISELRKEALILDRIIKDTEMQLEKELLIEEKEKIKEQLEYDKILLDYILSKLKEIENK